MEAAGVEPAFASTPHGERAGTQNGVSVPAWRRYWVYTQSVYCPVCLRERVTRERRYTEKPRAWSDRNVWLEHWDGCEL